MENCGVKEVSWTKPMHDTASIPLQRKLNKPESLFLREYLLNYLLIEDFILVNIFFI
jgi:hypothetical protein